MPLSLKLNGISSLRDPRDTDLVGEAKLAGNAPNTRTVGQQDIAIRNLVGDRVRTRLGPGANRDPQSSQVVQIDEVNRTKRNAVATVY
jgi:hypothetical protein